MTVSERNFVKEDTAKMKQGYIVITMEDVDISKIQTCPTFKPPKGTTYKEIAECYQLDTAFIEARIALKQNRNVIILRDNIE